MMAVEELKRLSGIRHRPQFRELPGPRRTSASGREKPRHRHQRRRSEHVPEIRKVFGTAELNIRASTTKATKKIGYNLIDMETTVDDQIIDLLSENSPKVIKVRVIHF